MKSINLFFMLQFVHSHSVCSRIITCEKRNRYTQYEELYAWMNARKTLPLTSRSVSTPIYINEVCINDLY